MLHFTLHGVLRVLGVCSPACLALYWHRFCNVSLRATAGLDPPLAARYVLHYSVQRYVKCSMHTQKTFQMAGIACREFWVWRITSLVSASQCPQGWAYIRVETTTKITCHQETPHRKRPTPTQPIFDSIQQLYTAYASSKLLPNTVHLGPCTPAASAAAQAQPPSAAAATPPAGTPSGGCAGTVTCCLITAPPPAPTQPPCAATRCCAAAAVAPPPVPASAVLGRRWGLRPAPCRAAPTRACPAT